MRRRRPALGRFPGRRLGLALALALAWSGGDPVQAAVTPAPGAEDSRIRSVDFDPQQVVQLTGFMGYQLMVEFAADERIENVAVGDAMAWQVTPNRRANLLFVKPLLVGAATNMTVVTDLRRYAFELLPGSEGARAEEMAYIVRFRFGAAEVGATAQPAPSPVHNVAYTVKGARRLAPAEVFDDGRFTYFRWAGSGALPAIYVLGPDGVESLPNSAVREGYVVVEQLAGRFLLRNGAAAATVTNTAWAPAGLAAPGAR